MLEKSSKLKELPSKESGYNRAELLFKKHRWGQISVSLDGLRWCDLSKLQRTNLKKFLGMNLDIWREWSYKDRIWKEIQDAANEDLSRDTIIRIMELLDAAFLDAEEREFEKDVKEAREIWNREEEKAEEPAPIKGAVEEPPLTDREKKAIKLLMKLVSGKMIDMVFAGETELPENLTVDSEILTELMNAWAEVPEVKNFVKEVFKEAVSKF